MKAILIITISLISFSVFGQTERKYIRSGNKLYDEKKYSDAELSYRKALDKKANSFESSFNIGNSLYKEGKFPEAANQFSNLTDATNDKDKLAKVYHNLGNSYVKSQKLQEGIDSYKKSLIQNPSDKDTKFNLAYVQRLLKQQQEQKEKDKQDKKEDPKDKKKEDKDNKDQQKKQDQQKQKDQQKQDQQKQEKKISPEDAQRMLDAVQNDEKKLQKKLEEQKASGEKVKVLKNW